MKDCRFIHDKTQELISVNISQFGRKENNELFPNIIQDFFTVLRRKYRAKSMFRMQSNVLLVQNHLHLKGETRIILLSSHSISCKSLSIAVRNQFYSQRQVSQSTLQQFTFTSLPQKTTYTTCIFSDTNIQRYVSTRAINSHWKKYTFF